MSNRERPPDKRKGPAAGGTAREVPSISKSDSSKHASGAIPRQDSAVAVYNGRVLLGSFVETAAGILVVDADGRLIQSVAKRSEAQRLLWQTHVAGGQP